MSKEAIELLNEALKLPAVERGGLADSLIESLDHHADPDAHSAWEAAIRRRIAELDSGEVEGVSWEQARKQIRRQLQD
jgi:putative addiction module component (TIGR02574 family)